MTDNFVNLGGNINASDGSESDIKRRIGIARGIFQNLSPVWMSKEISKNTKMRVYDTLLLSALLYNIETWTLKKT